MTVLTLNPPSVMRAAVLTPQECATLIAAARDLPPLSKRTWSTPCFMKLPAEVAESRAVNKVKESLRTANRHSWGLPREAWHVTVSSYIWPNSFPEHTDYSPGFPGFAPAITFAASVLLSDPADFEGGEVYVEGVEVPKAQGHAAMFHAFARHRVARITSGERLALNVFATMGTVRESVALGWPQRWVYADEDPRKQ